MNAQYDFFLHPTALLITCLCVSVQNPREADAMTKVQAELDETKIILVERFQELLVILKRESDHLDIERMYFEVMSSE